MHHWQDKIKSILRLIGVIALIVVSLFIYRACTSTNDSGGQIMNVPAYNQGDYTQTVAVINGENKSVKTSGCGAVALACVAQYITGSTKYDPQSLFEWANEHDFYNGNGLSHTALREMAALYRLKAEWTSDEKQVLNSFKRRHPVIAHVGHGTFSTGTGHYIVLVGLNEDGKVVIHDPGSRKRSGNAYDLDFIVNQTKGDQPFMIVR